MRRTLAALAIVALAVLGGSAAYGQTYGTGVMGSDTTNPPPGGQFTVTGSGCPAGSTVTFTIDGQDAGSTTADGNGNFSKVLTAPSTPGTHNVQATCGARVLALEITVSAAAAPSSPGLARTGSSSTMPLASLALALLAAGGLFMLVARRRRLAHRS